jgi:hypothetical protein
MFAGAALVGLAAGCVDRATDGGSRPDPGTPGPAVASRPDPGDSPPAQELESKLSDIINEQTRRHAPLQYKYTENLLEILDRIDRSLAGQDGGEPTRFLPALGADEERDHFRETVRRWQAKTGKTLRVEVDALKADVAARRPGKQYHPEFQRKFSGAFDDFIAMEVAELRERRNRAIHAAADALMAPYVDKDPAAIRRLRATLDAPPYDVPRAEPLQGP